jgi:hypothetical protein
MSPAHIHTRQPHLTYVLPLWPLYTLTQQEPTIDHAKTVVGSPRFHSRTNQKRQRKQELQNTKSKQQPRATLQDITHGQVKTTVTLHVGGCRELICNLVLYVQCKAVDKSSEGQRRKRGQI